MAGVTDEFRISTRALRQEVHELPGNSPAHPLVGDLDLGTYFRRTPSGNFLVGGAEPECDPLVWLDDPDDYAAAPTRAVYGAHAYRAARRLPGISVPTAIRGIMACTRSAPTGCRSTTARADGYYVAIGTSGNQFKNAPVVGGFLHSIVTACESGIDRDKLPVEHKLPRTGVVVVDLSHYSRLREPSQ